MASAVDVGPPPGGGCYELQWVDASQVQSVGGAIGLLGTNPDGAGHFEWVQIPCPQPLGGFGSHPEEPTGDLGIDSGGGPTGSGGGSHSGGGNFDKHGISTYSFTPNEQQAINIAINWAENVLLKAKQKLADMLKKCNPNGTDKNLNTLMNCLNWEGNWKTTSYNDFVGGDLQNEKKGMEGETIYGSNGNNTIYIDTHYLENSKDGSGSNFQFQTRLDLVLLHELVHNCTGFAGLGGVGELDTQIITSLMGFPRDPKGIDSGALGQMGQSGGIIHGTFFDWDSKNGTVKCKNGNVVGTIPNVS